MKLKYDSILGKLREEDSKTVFTGNTGDVFDDSSPSTTKGYTSSKISSELKQLIKEYGTNGRIRYDSGTKHWFFEVLDQGKWINKMEVGGSVYIDVVNFLESPKPTNIRPETVAMFGKKDIVQGQTIIRPRFVDASGNEFGFLVYDGTNHSVIYRKDNGTLEHIPLVYTDETGTEYNDLTKVKFIGANLSKNGSTLEVNINQLTDRQKELLKFLGLATDDSEIISLKPFSIGGPNETKSTYLNIERKAHTNSKGIVWEAISVDLSDSYNKGRVYYFNNTTNSTEGLEIGEGLWYAKEGEGLKKVILQDTDFVITPAARAAGWYIELDYDVQNSQPILTPKKR